MKPLPSILRVTDPIYRKRKFLSTPPQPLQLLFPPQEGSWCCLLCLGLQVSAWMAGPEPWGGRISLERMCSSCLWVYKGQLSLKAWETLDSGTEAVILCGLGEDWSFLFHTRVAEKEG